VWGSPGYEAAPHTGAGPGVRHRHGRISSSLSPHRVRGGVSGHPDVTRPVDRHAGRAFAA
jgi:hypothetical protein